MNRKIQILSLLFLGFSQFAFAQLKEEKLILDRKREPEIKRIEKKKTSVEREKNYPPIQKKVEDSLHLKYEITDVPPVSGFKTSTIQGADIAPAFNSAYQDSYFRVGYGNYGKILADGNISTVLENKTEVGADVHYLSTNGLKKEYEWDSKQSQASLGAYLNSYGDQGKFSVNANYSLDNYNYYGIYALPADAGQDLKQKTNIFSVNGYYDFYSNEILNDIRVKSSFLSDHFDAKETYADVLANLSKHGVSVYDDITMNADLGLGLETQNTTFKILTGNSSDFLNLTAAPKLTFYKGKSYLTIGSGFAFLNGKNDNSLLSEKVKTSKTYWFPKAELLFAAADEFKFYAGIDGGLMMNSYASLLQQNPYLLPDQYLKPGETQYHIYFGLKGDIDQTVKYEVSAGYAKLKNMMFFAQNGLQSFDAVGQRNSYDYINTFSAVYDDGTVSSVKGSLQFFPLENLALDAELNYSKYKLDHNNDIYNIPLLKAEIGAHYTMLNKKLLLGFIGFFATDRTANAFAVSSGINPDILIQTENTDEKVGGYADLNLSAEYKIHKNFSIFALGNNLLNSSYQTYKGYKVLGAQIAGGIKITF